MADTTEDLCEKLARTKRKAEIINGEIVVLPFDTILQSKAKGNIAFSLSIYKKRTNFGRVFLSNIAYIVDLPNRKSFSPTVSYHIGERSG